MTRRHQMTCLPLVRVEQAHRFPQREAGERGDHCAAMPELTCHF